MPQSPQAATERPLLNIVVAVPPKREGGRKRFAPMGTAFPHRGGKGFNLVLDTMPVNWSQFLAFPRAAKGEGEVAPAEATPLEEGRFTVYVPLPRRESDGQKKAEGEGQRKEFLSPCGVAFPHEKGGGFTVYLNALPRDWTRLVLLPEGEEHAAEDSREEDVQ